MLFTNKKINCRTSKLKYNIFIIKFEAQLQICCDLRLIINGNKNALAGCRILNFKYKSQYYWLRTKKNLKNKAS